MKVTFLHQAEKTRRAILRGVLEENLKLLGRRRLRPQRRRHRPPAGLLAVPLAILIVLLHGMLVPSPWYPEPRVQAGPVGFPADSHRLSEKTGVRQFPEEYRDFLTPGGWGSPVRRLLGLGVRTIMIDPGHGGDDTGAMGTLGTAEKDIVLDISRRLRRRLEKHDSFRVLLTREDDRTLALRERVTIARQEHADLFVSVHLNFLPQRPINIIETFYFGPARDAKTTALAEQENAGSRFALSDFRAILAGLGNTMKLQESRELASAIQNTLYTARQKTDADIFDRGTKRAPFVVLLGVEVPAVLVEVSCLSNPAEEQKLNTWAHREEIARHLEQGILEYLRRGGIRYAARG